MDGSQSESDDRDRILIADDDPDFLEALELWLADYGDLAITAVTNGADAVEAVDSSVSVFLCDRRMPELRGHEVLERIKQQGYDIPTIVISAYGPDSYLHEGDVDHYLQKPIDRDELFEAIDQVRTG